MPRHSSKQAILDAAEAVVIKSGASHMTLDAVAERSGISKGGLMYHFPSKEALLEAMISRMVERFQQRRDEVRQDNNQDRPNELVVELRTLQGEADIDCSLSAALLAVIANQPALTRKLREDLRDRFFTMIASHENFTQSAILFFAAVGIHFHDLLNLSFLSNDQRMAIFKELIRLACSDALEYSGGQ